MRGRPLIVAALVVLSIAGGGLALTYDQSLGDVVAQDQSTNLLDCGFVLLSTTNVPTPGLPSGTTYIQFSPALSTTVPTSSVTAKPNLYDVGSLGSMYFDGELGIGCSSTPTSGTISMQITISGSGSLGGAASWVVVFVAPHSSNGYCQPGTAIWASGSCSGNAETACDTTVQPNLYLPNNGFDTHGNAGNTLTWSWGTGTKESPCSGASLTNPLTASVPTSVTSIGGTPSGYLYDVSFGYGGVVSSFTPSILLSITTTVS